MAEAGGSASSAARHEEGFMTVREDGGTTDVDALEREYARELDAVRRTFASGRTRSLEWRLGQLAALHKGILETLDESIEALRKDLGRHEFEVLFLEFVAMMQEIELVQANLASWMQPEKVTTPVAALPASSYIVREPKGAVLVLGPWNYPISLVLTPLINLIAAGNVAVLKPSEVSANCAKVTEKIIVNYLDRDAFRVVQGAVPETTALLRLRWDHIMYTGNGAVGRIVQRAAAAHLTPVTLELGGKSPAYIDKSASIKTTAKRLINTKAFNNGQTCIAPDFLLVHESVLDPLLHELKAAIESFFGKDLSKSPSYGRVVNERHWDRIARLMDPANHGGQVLTGGLEKAVREDRFIPITLILNPSLDSAVMQEEIFGAVLPIISVRSEEEAREIILAREKPLALYVFASQQPVIDRFVNNVSSGGVCVNDCIFHCGNSHLPFGGVGNSGMGTYHGVYGFREFSHSKGVMSRPTWLDPGLRYPPYSDSQGKLVRNIVENGLGLPPAVKIGLVAAAGALGALAVSRL